MHQLASVEQLLVRLRRPGELHQLAEDLVDALRLLDDLAQCRLRLVGT